MFQGAWPGATSTRIDPDVGGLVMNRYRYGCFDDCVACDAVRQQGEPLLVDPATPVCAWLRSGKATGRVQLDYARAVRELRRRAGAVHTVEDADFIALSLPMRCGALQLGPGTSRCTASSSLATRRQVEFHHAQKVPNVPGQVDRHSGYGTRRGRQRKARRQRPATPDKAPGGWRPRS